MSRVCACKVQDDGNKKGGKKKKIKGKKKIQLFKYSTVKSIAVELAGKVDLKLEVTELEGEQHDLSEESLLKALHPVVAEARVSNRVTKPKGPGRPRQLIK